MTYLGLARKNATDDSLPTNDQDLKGGDGNEEEGNSHD